MKALDRRLDRPSVWRFGGVGGWVREKKVALIDMTAHALTPTRRQAGRQVAGRQVGR
jgi:hypothetical protein